MVKPKAILFDIGGVCVISPMSAIADYETQNGIPKDWVNFAISRTSPNGSFHKLERGEIKLDDGFFAQFKADLHRQDLWEQYHKTFKHRRGSLADAAKANATQLGDPISLKAETSSTIPTPDEAGAGPSVSLATNAPSSGKTSLQESYQKNMLGDPTSLKNEGSSSDPLPDQSDTGYSKSSSSTDSTQASQSQSSNLPPLPQMDTTTLFWDMMARARQPDPHMFPALLNLRASKKFIVAALSNTVIFPPDHEFSNPKADDVRNQFDLFVSSAEIGMRKPEPAVYKITTDKIDQYDRSKGGSGVKPEEIVFLDDIGTNLKGARQAGWQTIKVNMGSVDKAVAELEKVTGLQLAEKKAKL